TVACAHSPAGGIDDRRIDLDIGSALQVIRKSSFNVDGGRALRHIVPESAVDEYSIRNYCDGCCFHQPDMPINAGALIEPAFKLRYIDPHSYGISGAVVNYIRDVIAK